MSLPYASILAASAAAFGGLVSTGCGCDDCTRAGPTVGYVRALVQEENAGPIQGASVHLDNRMYITDPGLTRSDGIAVLLVEMGPQPSDTGTVTIVPPSEYDTPLPQVVTIPAGDTVYVSFPLRRVQP